MAPRPELEARDEPPSQSVRLTVGGEAMAFAGGASVGLSLGLEGERAGITAAANHLSVIAGDGSGSFDSIKQLNVRFTYALLAGTRGRSWRKGAVALTPFPFRQLDYRGGLGLGFGALGLRAGWRTLVLDDAGLVDGIAHRDVFSGPYAGVSLVF